MTGSLALPLWILAVVGALALWAALDRILMPSARWFLRRRLNRMIEEVNTRLELQIPPSCRPSAASSSTSSATTPT